MIKKATEAISAILKRILFIGFSIQIILGIVWMCFNLAHLQEFAVTESPLYQVLCNMTGKFFPLLYLLQLGLAVYAGYSILQSVSSLRGFWRVWGMLVLLTFPMAMQCHLAVSPYSFAGSLFLLELSFCVRILREKEGNILLKITRGCLCWLLLALLLPEYFLLGAIPLILVFLLSLSEMKKKWRVTAFMLVLLASLGGMIANSFTRENIAFSLFSRMGWPTLYNDYKHFSDAVYQEHAGTVWLATYSPDEMEREIRPLLEEVIDKEQLAAYYGQRALLAWQEHSSMIMRQIGWDVLGYSVTPLVLPIQLSGKAYDSCSGRNYEFMLNHTPVMTRCYVSYSCWWFGVMLIAGLFLAVINGIGRIGAMELRTGWKVVLLCLAGAAAVVLVYTMRGAGLMDYKATFAVNLLWMVWILVNMAKKAEMRR